VTLAGSGVVAQVNGWGTSATFNFITSIAWDAASGTAIVFDFSSVRRVTGVSAVNASRVSFVAGGTFTGNDGVGTSAGFTNACVVACDGTGIAYATCGAYNVLRRIVLRSGAVTTVAGLKNAAGSVSLDGLGTTALFASPSGVAVDASGAPVWLESPQTGAKVIRRWDPASNQTTTIAGPPALLTSPSAIAWDAVSASLLTLTSAPSGSNAGAFARVRRVWLGNGTVVTLAGTAVPAPAGAPPLDGPALVAGFASILGVAYDSARGLIYFADSSAGIVRRLNVSANWVDTLAGGAANGGRGCARRRGRDGARGGRARGGRRRRCGCRDERRGYHLGAFRQRGHGRAGGLPRGRRGRGL
jgi:hypothetical protein